MSSTGSSVGVFETICVQGLPAGDRLLLESLLQQAAAAGHEHAQIRNGWINQVMVIGQKGMHGIIRGKSALFAYSVCNRLYENTTVARPCNAHASS